MTDICVKHAAVRVTIKTEQELFVRMRCDHGHAASTRCTNLYWIGLILKPILDRVLFNNILRIFNGQCSDNIILKVNLDIYVILYRKTSRVMNE